MDSDMTHWHFDYVRLAWDSGFFFGNSKQNEKVDYSTIGLVDIEKISRDRDYATVEKHISTIINFTLQEELSKVLEPTFVKLFKLGQLSVEYLQFCKKYLDNTVILLKKELNDRQATCDNFRKDCDNMNQYVSNLKKKNKDLKTHLQLLEAQNLVSFNCPHCNKIFSTAAYLEAHINRRHTDALLDPPPPTNMQIEADKLQLEIKELKERLNSSEKFVHSEHSSETVVHKNDIHNKLELHRQHVESELEAIRVANAFKYEQLSETMLHNFRESQKPAVMAQTVKTDKGYIVSHDGSTQTENNVRYADSNLNTEEVFDTNNVDVKHEIGDIKSITEQHLQELAAILEQKVSINLAHLETKLETLLNKCSTLNSTRLDENQLVRERIIDTSPIRQIVTPNLEEPKAAPRKQQEIPSKNVPAVRPKPRSKFLSCAENTIYSGQIFKENQEKVTFIKSPEKVISSSSGSEYSSTESESDSVSSDDSEEVPMPVPEALKPTVKVSNTSTLRNRSLTSLRQAVDDNVTEGLAKELENVLSQKLQSIGVSPEWTRIPKKSFEQAMKITNHRNKAIFKNYPNYNKCRESILFQLKTKVKEILSNKMGTSRPKTAKPIPQQKIKYSPYQKRNINNQQKVASKEQHTTPSPSTSNYQYETESPTKQTPSPTATKMAVQTGKKRVLFDLDTEESSASVSSYENRPQEAATEAPPSVVAVTGSTTSIASSVFDEPHKELLSGKEKEQQRKFDEKAKKAAVIEEDVSDWDISDILAT